MKFSSIPNPQRSVIVVEIALRSLIDVETNAPTDDAKFIARIRTKDASGREIYIKADSEELLGSIDKEKGNPLLHAMIISQWIQASLIRVMLGPDTYLETKPETTEKPVQ